MAVQAHAPESEGLRPDGSALNRNPSTAFLAPPPPPPSTDGAVVELIGHPTTPPRFATRTAIDSAVESAVLPHQLHEIDQVVEIARLGELLVEKDARIALLERGLADWRERARVEMEAHAGAERIAFERERDLVGVIHQQISAIESAEASTGQAFAQADELRARLDDQMALVDSAEQNTQAALARMQELQARIDELEERLRQRARHWWSRRSG
jgi:peptidoglycan hydrolase CwlO-like protein